MMLIKKNNNLKILSNSIFGVILEPPAVKNSSKTLFPDNILEYIHRAHSQKLLKIKTSVHWKQIRSDKTFYSVLRMCRVDNTHWRNFIVHATHVLVNCVIFFTLRRKLYILNNINQCTNSPNFSGGCSLCSLFIILFSFIRKKNSII